MKRQIELLLKMVSFDLFVIYLLNLIDIDGWINEANISATDKSTHIETISKFQSLKQFIFS